uniref:Zinc knuckle CX2CX4HX4C n=1 Tax=Tanacetum cinerariifolium TaxID=118510 RepID=A0A6L2JME7_TANCI|nr:hypothetical protein [Tanacetum cinerariifolium]
MITKTNIETLFGVKFTSLSDIDDFSMSIKEGKYAYILSTMYFADIDTVVNVIETIGKKFQDEVNKAGGTQLTSSPKVSTFSTLVSPSTTINVPYELNVIDVAATFRVSLTTLGDLDKLINDIKAGKHEELLSGMTNDDHMETLDALGSICNSFQANCNKFPSKDTPGDSIVQSMDINTKSTSYVNSEADLVDSVTIGIHSLTGDDFTKETIRIEYEWRLPRCYECKIFGHVHDHYPKKMVNPPIVTTSNVVTPTIEKSNDGFQMVGKKKKWKETTIAPKKGATNVSNPSKSSSMLKTEDTFPKNDNFTTSNSFSTLNDEEVENVYNKSANLVPNTNTAGSSSFMAAAG